MKDNKRLSTEVHTTYSLRRFKSSRDPNFVEALQIYTRSITPESHTNTNDITYWLDRGYGEFGDDFCVFGFFKEDRIIGFAQLAYFRVERILFFDYLVLSKDHRAHGEYYAFVGQLQKWVDDSRLEIDYVVAEVSYECGGPIPSERSIALVELFKFMGFAVADCDYHQPPLGTDNPQSETMAHLLVTARERVRSIQAGTLKKIVETIYFHHYLRWYSAFLKETEQYEMSLRDRLETVRRSIGTRADVVLNGVRHSNPTILPTPAPRARKQKWLGHPMLAFAVISAICCLFLLIQHQWGLPWKTVILTMMACLLTFVATVSLSSARGGRTLDSLIRLFGRFRA